MSSSMGLKRQAKKVALRKMMIATMELGYDARALGLTREQMLADAMGLAEPLLETILNALEAS